MCILFLISLSPMAINTRPHFCSLIISKIHWFQTSSSWDAGCEDALGLVLTSLLESSRSLEKFFVYREL